MAIQRSTPYGAFNFLVDLGTGETDGAVGGFAECSEIGMEVAVTEYRNGNERQNQPRKITGLTRPLDVELRRGVIGSLALYSWISDTRDAPPATRDVTITLLSEQRDPVLIWHLLRAQIVRHASGPLDALSGDVAIEEIVLSYERLELE